VLIDIIEGKPQGLGSGPEGNCNRSRATSPTIVGTNDYADTTGSDVVVITAGFPRKPGMSRMDLLGKNAAIMTDVIAQVTAGSPNAILIVVSNPLDEMTFLAAGEVRLPARNAWSAWRASSIRRDCATSSPRSWACRPPVSRR
jgi:malate dehydrogenase